MKRIFSTLGLLLYAVSLQAAELPSSSEVKKVLDFYYHGQGLGVVLIDTRLCRDVFREGDEKSECSGDLAGTPVAKGEEFYLWMAFMVPSGDEKQNILIQFDHGGVTRTVKSLQVNGSLRYRTWRKAIFDRTGAWTIKISHDRESGAQDLGSISVNVQ